VSHADYILYQDTLRLKHKGDQIAAIKLQEVVLIINKAINFFQSFFRILEEHKKSYQDGHIITGRKNKAGGNLSSIKLSADPLHGVTGISTSDPLPLW